MGELAAGRTFRAEGPGPAPVGGPHPEPARHAMLDVREPSDRRDARIVELLFRGTVGPADLERAVHEIRTRTDERDPGSLVVDLDGALSPSPDALLGGLRERLRRPDWLRGVERIALLADATWRDRLARVEGAFVEGPPVRLFELGRDDRDAPRLARRWLAERREAERRETRPGADERGAGRVRPAPISLIPVEDRCTVAFEVAGGVGPEDLRRLRPAFERALAGDGGIRLLVRVLDAAALGAAAGAASDARELGRRLRGRLTRCAIVSPPAFVRAFAARTAWARPARVRTFAERDETTAWAWLGVAPAGARRPPP